MESINVAFWTSDHASPRWYSSLRIKEPAVNASTNLATEYFFSGAFMAIQYYERRCNRQVGSKPRVDANPRCRPKQCLRINVNPLRSRGERFSNREKAMLHH